MMKLGFLKSCISVVLPRLVEAQLVLDYEAGWVIVTSFFAGVNDSLIWFSLPVRNPL